LAPILFLISAPAWATDSDYQFWSIVTAAKPLSDTVTATANGSWRFRPASAGNDQWLVQGALDDKLAQHVSIGASLTYSSTATVKEVRPGQSLTFSFGNLALRTQLEERFFNGSTQMGLRLRERAQLHLPIDKSDQLGLSAETLFVLRPTVQGKQTGFDQLRLGVTDEHRLTSHFGVSLGYLMIWSSRRNAADRIDHVPQLTLSWKG